MQKVKYPAIWPGENFLRYTLDQSSANGDFPSQSYKIIDCPPRETCKPVNVPQAAHLQF